MIIHISQFTFLNELTSLGYQMENGKWKMENARRGKAKAS